MAQLDLRSREQDRFAREKQALEEQAHFYQTEAADVRERMQHLAGQNQDLEQRLNRALAHLDNRSFGPAHGSSYALNESVAERSRERVAAAMAAEARARSGERGSSSPLRPARAAYSPHQDVSAVELSNQARHPVAETAQEALQRSGHRPGGSPLRSKSRSHSRSIMDQSMPGAVHQTQLPPPSQGGRGPLASRSVSRSPGRLSAYEDNQERMRVSQERIASILGLDKQALTRPGGAPVRPPPAIPHPPALEARPELIAASSSPYRFEPGRGRSPGLDAPVHPLRYSREASREHPADRLPGDPPFATTMVKQSLADLKSRLQQMRQEK